MSTMHDNKRHGTSGRGQMWRTPILFIIIFIIAIAPYFSMGTNTAARFKGTQRLGSLSYTDVTPQCVLFIIPDVDP